MICFIFVGNHIDFGKQKFCTKCVRNTFSRNTFSASECIFKIVAFSFARVATNRKYTVCKCKKIAEKYLADS